ncbi:MAG: cold shock domain-containing protein [bacterium]|nr:cold shock domain-containing protein [bacterium]
MMAFGIVRCFNQQKGCGYIEQKDGTCLFFYDPHLLHSGRLKEGGEVYYEKKAHESGLFSLAVNVQLPVNMK